MKFVVRAFVIALVLTGAAASTYTSASTTSARVTLQKASAMPPAVCPPDDPNACGMGGGVQ